MSDQFEDLNDLWSSARQTIHAARVAAHKEPRRQKLKEPLPPPDTTYSNPANWRRTQGIALIHAETKTLLGNFSEYIHSDGVARRLVREDAPITVAKAEEVSGDWWIKPNAAPLEPVQEGHTKHDTIMHILLPKLNVHCPLCEITAHIAYGAIARVELATETMFAQTAEGDHLLWLPAGTNILGEMGQDTKIQLWQEIKRED